MRFFPLLLLLAACAAGAADLNEDLLAAARKGDLAAVKALVGKGADVNTRTHYGVTPLFYAAANGHLEVVRLLIDKGADPNPKDTFYNATAVGWAASKGQVAVVKLLLEKGAAVDEVLLAGVAGGHLELVKAALARGGYRKETVDKALAAAAQRKNVEMQELLRTAGGGK